MPVRSATAARKRLVGAVVSCILVAAAVGAPWVAAEAIDEPLTGTWISEDDAGSPVVELYFVFSSTCPHCQAALPFVADLAESNDWLRVWWLQADAGDPRVAEVATAVAAEIGEPIRAVPTFMYCGTMHTGWDGVDGAGASLLAELEACHASILQPAVTPTTTVPVADHGEAVELPGVGTIESNAVPLPVFTAIVAGLDAFNPCAFFVLLFLLSLLVHARSRIRMAGVGITFVVVSGVLYFVFMAAWLNVFLVTENLRLVTLVAGGVAAVLGVLSAKDYFAPDAGPSTSIPDAARPRMFDRMRNLISVDRVIPVMVATVALAVVANSYELLCTAGLPMVFTRVLTLNDLSTPAYYGYLALYNAIYVIPLLAIVGAFVWTLGSRKLQPAEGRVLKLLSGTMMVGLGLVLLVAPDLLEHVGTAILVVLIAVGTTAAVVLVDRVVHRARPSTS